MSHLKERKEKICLNCNAELIGRYCHVCGQENLEPKETVWHLVQHFFNDITHFDGKFFSTVKYLLKKPGFLSAEYMAGRRMSYLNPIRMYVFTSAIFFIIIFSISKPEKMVHEKKEAPVRLTDLERQRDELQKKLPHEEDEDDIVSDKKKLANLDILIKHIQQTYGDSSRQTFTRPEREEIVENSYADSLQNAHLSEDDRKRITKLKKKANTSEATVFGLQVGDYANVEEYDSTERALPDSLRDGWLRRSAMHRLIAMEEERRENPRLFKEHLIENIFHSFPKILFISLPIFAMILNILYFRRKKTYYYVSHGIFSIHVYCATFILMLICVLLDQLQKALNWKWFSILAWILIVLVILYMLIYLYKAMRGFYRQGGMKTFIKYFITCSVAFFVNTFLLVLFVLIALISV